MCGSCTYRSITGERVRITAVFETSDAKNVYKWDDAEFVGLVADFLGINTYGQMAPYYDWDWYDDEMEDFRYRTEPV